jgi:hypothetical protein
MSFHLLPNGLEEAQFKRVPEGWLFSTASPWIFAPRGTYLVSDAQKPAIAERVRRGRYLRLVVILLLMALMAVGIIMNPVVLMLMKTFSLAGRDCLCIVRGADRGRDPSATILTSSRSSAICRARPARSDIPT